ncbi:hypothetical protein LTR70_008853 [Exophiala xenobiotica]|uniref:Epoxide hydrolase N-terminal domain-containing protein n=1 Tax=Lithohypha guttulata TaxID=1690604 RepID=A0ABR0JZU1_9EURO|nr:hypothetical protein LTR24_008515 [Lithohypha guttulata]KAK5311317.1 hypothetical protein LTR70_008853 [Exophiala xenobiotica]
MSYDSIPSKATLRPETFTAHVSDQELDDFKQLLKLSKLGPKTYENQNNNDERYLGIKREWLADAKSHWETKYDWRRTENRINSFPNFTVKIEDINVHFVALFSKKSDAVPLTLLHGWPGSFLEFLGVCDVLKEKYSEDDLPVHIIVPSLPGYGYSSGPPLDRDYTVSDMARIIDQLMTGLGFGDGYVSQGGDIGSFVSRILGGQYNACKAVHLNFCIGAPMPNRDDPMKGLSDVEKRGLQRANDFNTLGNAYGRMHGTRPATIGLCLSSSPLALLAWIGEKFQVWTDTDPTLDEILDSVTLYWFTESFPRAIFPYRQFFSAQPALLHADPKLKIEKPKALGYSYFPLELAPVPKAWVEQTGDLVWYREHTEGGHFAAMEKPKLFAQDMEDFVKEVWKK